MRSLNILLIEDDAIELMKFKRVMEKLSLNHAVTEASDGGLALSLLQTGSVCPDIIILDLNMPKINGIEFLSVLKSKSELQHIPVVILTTSSNERDVKSCYQLGIAGYLLKPLKYDEYVSLLQNFLVYWSQNVLISNTAPCTE